MIRGNSVLLRAPEPEDLENIHRWGNDSEVSQFMGRDRPSSCAQVRDRLEGHDDPTRRLPLCIDTLQGVHIGTCALGGIDAVNRSAGLGIMIGEKQFWGKGYGTDATLALCGFGFGQMNLHRIQLYVYTFNRRAIRSYEKCGFAHEGLHRQVIYKLGKYQDVAIMGLLSDEFSHAWPEGYPG